MYIFHTRNIIYILLPWAQQLPQYCGICWFNECVRYDLPEMLRQSHVSGRSPSRIYLCFICWLCTIRNIKYCIAIKMSKCLVCCNKQHMKIYHTLTHGVEENDNHQFLYALLISISKQRWYKRMMMRFTGKFSNIPHAYHTFNCIKYAAPSYTIAPWTHWYGLEIYPLHCHIRLRLSIGWCKSLASMKPWCGVVVVGCCSVCNVP